MSEFVSAQRAEEYLRAHCFTPAPAGGSAVLRFGAELELLALRSTSRLVAPMASDDGEGTVDVARAAGARLGWTECPSAKGSPRFVSPGGGALGFEPGGQLEYASSVHRSLELLLHELHVAEHTLRDEASKRGIDLVAVGIDPSNDIASAPLQLFAPRYRRMAAHFASIGADGARMMRQTASLQLCVGGVDTAARFRLANALAPWLIALFANSPRYAGKDTGCASHRAETWRGVDPARTGILAGDDPVREYAAFALAAPAFLLASDGEAATPLSGRRETAVSDTELAVHLSTLFPEVRPRGYLELRSADAVDAPMRNAAALFVAGLLGDARSAAVAAEIVDAPDPGLLWAAGRQGLGNARLANGAADLVDVAMAGCRRLGKTVISAGAVDAAGETLDDRLSAALVGRHAVTGD